MRLRSQVARLERAAIQVAANPVSDSANRCAFLHAGDVWAHHFARGRALSLPAGHDRRDLVREACVQARVRGAIGPVDYLRGMTREERQAADHLCR